MPIYEYECERGHRIERFARVTDPGEPLERVPCERCTKRPPRNVVGLFFAILVPSRTGKPILVKGIGGFYNPTR